jgi:WD40 repeat protein
MNDPRSIRTTNPFPGLRPFRQDEDYLFFGRESQVDAMVDGLAATRFLVVVGTSGSGKSSLVNCGLIPALRRGLMARAGIKWRIARFRPGASPITELAKALAKDGVLFRDFQAGRVSLAEIVETTLRMSKLGLIDICEQARLDPAVNVLVVADQFEELFRYGALAADEADADQGPGEEAAAFVNLLLEVMGHPHCPVYVVLTMRSDFLGDCAQFPGLPEAINACQYLVPRMTRDERRAAIEGPIRVAGAEISPVLVTRLVNDAGDNPDQLSVLQHALNRTWAHWRHEDGTGPLELAHYSAIGTMARALDAHAEQAFNDLEDDRRKRICEALFKALTDKATDVRGVRRPTRLATLCALTGAGEAEVARVIDVFRAPERSFLMPPHDEVLEPETVVDISHESLMRGWRRLRGWADEEAQSAQIYGRLAEAARLHAAGQVSLWRDPELQLGLAWRARERPTPAWAARYHGGFEQAMAFLDASAAARRWRRTRIIGSMVLATLVAALGAGYWVHLEQSRLEHEKRVLAVSQAESALEHHRPVRAMVALLEGYGPSDRQAIDLRDQQGFERTLWSALANSRLERILSDQGAEVRAVDFNNSGTRMVSGAYDGKALVYDTVDWRPVAEIDENKFAPDQEWNWILGVEFSPDGKLVATAAGSTKKDGTRRGRVRIWDAESGAFVRDLTAPSEAETAHAGPARSVAFSGNGRWLVSSSYDNTAAVWDVFTGHLVRRLAEQGDKDVYAGAFHPHNPMIVATGGNDNIIRVWCLSGLSWSAASETEHSQPPRPEAAALPRGRPGGGQAPWCTEGGDTAVKELKGHDQRITSLTFSPDGKHLMSSSDDDTVRIWDWLAGTQVGRPLVAHTADIWRAIFDSSGEHIFTVSWDRTIGIWDEETFRLLARVGGHDEPIRTVAYDPFADRLATGSRDGTVRIWRLEPEDVVMRLRAYLGVPKSIRFNLADAREFATAGGDGTVRVWRVGKRVPHQILDHVLQGEGRRCETSRSDCAAVELAFASNGTHLAARYLDEAVRIWDIERGAMVGDPIRGSGPRDRIRALAALDGRNIVAIGTTEGHVLFHFMSRNGEVAMKPLDALAALRAAGGTGRDASVIALDYNRERNLLAAGLGGGAILVWDLATGRLLPLIETGDDFVSRVRFSADGTRVFAALGTGGTVQIWNIGDPTPAFTMGNHSGMVTDMAIMDDGRRLITVSTDESIKIWDTALGYEVVSLPGHDRTINAVAYEPSTGLLYTAAQDGTVLVRRMFHGHKDLRAAVCASLRAKNLAGGTYLEKTRPLDELCPPPG